MGYKPQYDFTSLGVLVGTVGGGVMNAGSANLGPVGFTPLPGRSTADSFTPADVGRIVTVMGAGPGGTVLKARVQTYVDAQNVVLTVAASTSVGDGISNTTIFRPVKVKLDSQTFSENITDAPSGEFTTEQLNGEYPPEAGQPFLYTTTDPALADSFGTFWGGEIDSVETVYEGFGAAGQKVTQTACKCVSYKAVLQRRVMMGKQFSSTDAVTTVAYLCAQATADFIDYACDANPTISLFTTDDYSYIADNLDNLCSYLSAGTTKYFWYIDHWRTVHLITNTSRPAPWSISDTGGSDGNVKVRVSKTRTREKLANQVYAKCSKTLGDASVLNVANSFNGAPLPQPRRSITLAAKAGILPKIVVNGTPKVVWVSPIDPRSDTTSTVTIPAGYDWAWPEGSDFLFCDASRPGIPSGGTATVTSYPTFEAVSHTINSVSLSERSAVQGGSGLHEAVESVDTPLSKSELDAWVAGHVAAFGTVPESVTVEGFRSGLRQGMGLTVHLTEIGATVNYLVESVQMSEQDGWVAWAIKASIGAILGDWTASLVRALGGSASAGGATGGFLSGSTLSAQFVGGSGIATVAYAAKILVNGGTSPYTFQVQSGDSTPAGLSLDSTTGLLSGTPTTAGSYDFHVAVLDAHGDSVVVPCHIDVATAPSTGGENTGTATALTASEIGPVYQDFGGALHTAIQGIVSITPDAGWGIRFRVWVDFSDSRGPIILGDRYADASPFTFEFGQAEQRTGQSIPGDIYVPVDPTKANWRMYVECNSQSQLPSVAAQHYDFTVLPAQPVNAADVTNLQFAANDSGDTIDYVTDHTTQYWIPHEIDVSLPDADSAPYIKSLFLTVQAGYIVSASGTVSGGNSVALSSGAVQASDAGLLVFLNGVPFRMDAYVDPTHFTIKAAAAGMASTASNGSASVEVFRNAPSNRFFGDAGKDDAYAYAQGYWGRKFTDLPGPVKGSPSMVSYHGEPLWDIIPPEYEDGSSNPFVYHLVFGFGVSRLADNEAGGGVGTITFIPNWVTGKPYGLLHAVLQDHPLDLRNVGRSKSFADTSISGGNGAKHRANLGYSMYLDDSGQIAFQNVPNLSSLPTLPQPSKYPAGSLIRLSTTGKVYRTDGFTWAVSNDPQDLAAGAIASGVTLNANQVNAGTFNGCLLILNLNGITTTIGNVFENTTSTYVGLKVLNNTSGQYGMVGSTLSGVVSPGVCESSMGAGSFAYVEAMYGTSGIGVRLLAPSTGGYITIDGYQVLKTRQAGPGFTTDSGDLAGRFNALVIVLRNHGLIT